MKENDLNVFQHSSAMPFHSLDLTQRPFACLILLFLTFVKGPCQQFFMVLADICNSFFDITPEGKRTIF